MNRQFRISVLFLVFFACYAGSLFSQKMMTLDQCIYYAWDNNFTIRNQNLDVGIRKADYRQARNNILPNLSFQSSFNENYGRSINPSTNTYIGIQYFNSGYSLSSSVDLFAGFMKVNTLEMQKFNYLAEKNHLQQLRNELAFTIIDNYFNVLLQTGLAAIALENYKLSHDQLEGTMKFVEVGRKPGTDLLETEANVAADSSLLVQSHHLLEQAVLVLKSNMNFPVPDSLVIDTIVPSILSGMMDTLSMNKIYQMASEVLPDLAVYKNKMLAAKKAMQVSKGNFSPNLGFYASWSSQYAETNKDTDNHILPFSDQFTNNSYEYLSLNLSIPLFTRFSNMTSLSKSKLQYQQAKNQYEEVNYNLKMTTEKSLTDWRAAMGEYKSSLHQLNKSYNAYLAAEKKLEKGLINIIEFDIQKNKWVTAKTELLRIGLQVMLKERYLRFLMTGSLLNEK
jgi:outer membrane protein TolC